jgi:hypothetical protein
VHDEEYAGLSPVLADNLRPFQQPAITPAASTRGTNMSSLLDDLASQFQGPTLSHLSQQVGADEATTAQAVKMSLPLLIGGLANEVETPAGAQSLNRALDEDHDGTLLDDPLALLGGTAGGTADVAVPRALNGEGILGHIFGGKREPVQQGIGQATGLSSQQTGRLLMMLAPLVMAYLGRRKRQLNTNDIAGEVRAQRQEVEQRAPGLGGILGQIFGGGAQDRPGIADDLARMAPNILGGMFGGR